MTTDFLQPSQSNPSVVEAYRLDRYDNRSDSSKADVRRVVEAYRLDRYDNFHFSVSTSFT